MTTAAESYASGLAARRSGREREAAAAFLMAFAAEPGNAAYRRAAFDVLNVMSGYRTLPPAILTALEISAQDSKLDLQPISLVVRNLIENDPRLTAITHNEADLESILVDHAWFLEHRLLLAVLARAVNISPKIESVLTALRRHACLRVAGHEETALISRFRPFLLALTQQCVVNKHAWHETPEEEAAIEQLSHRADSDALLLRTAYRPLHDIASEATTHLEPAIEALWHEETELQTRARQLEEATPLAPGLSSAMRKQYEGFPYPRWRQLDETRQVPLATIVQHHAPHLPRIEELAGKVDILVAGCGTGITALTYASTVQNANVFAVDISRTSLAYGARKADDMGITNARFAVADILKLGELGKTFDFIDCSGVLHHMTDPQAGLAVLRQLLRPHGVLVVALYSARGRASENAARAFVQSEGFADTPDGMRTARQAIMALPETHPVRAVMNTPDFFTLDGLHDLIFNIHESHTSPAAMKQMLTDCGLTAIGVEAPALLGGNKFRSTHPDPAHWADLDLWDAYEKEHPHVFAHMIRAWCRRSDAQPL